MTLLPDAVVVGSMKAGTSWIHDYLGARGDVLLPSGVKETFFFDRRFGKGPGWYSSHFVPPRGEAPLRVVEVAPSYFHHGETPRRMHDVLGDVALVASLRDPVERTWSHYVHLLRKGHTRLGLREAAREHPELLAASRYREQLERWRAVFGEEGVAVLCFDDLVADPVRFTGDLCRALGLPPVELTPEMSEPANQAAVAPSPRLASLGIRLADHLRDRRLYFLVNLAKRAGLQAVFFGRPGGAPPPRRDAGQQAWLERELASEVAWYREWRDGRASAEPGAVASPVGQQRAGPPS